MQKEAVFVIMITVSASGCISHSSTWKVVEVRDGDTLEAKKNDDVRTFRLIGIDTPETGRVSPGEYGLSGARSIRACLSRIASEAKEEAEKLEHTRVRIVHYNNKGSYGRSLAYVFPLNQSRSLNSLLVSQGRARVYNSFFKMRSDFLESQRYAKLNDRGIWNCS